SLGERRSVPIPVPISPVEKEAAMVTGHFATLRGAAFALVLTLVAGCQSPGNLSTAGTTASPPETQAPLTKPQRADLKVALGRSLENGGDIDRALNLYTEAVASDPK